MYTCTCKPPGLPKQMLPLESQVCVHVRSGHSHNYSHAPGVMAPFLLDQTTSTAGVVAWIKSSLSQEPWVREVVDSALQANLDGRTILAMEEDELAQVLKLKVFGRKRKLTLLLKEAKGASAAPPPPSGVAAPANSGHGATSAAACAATSSGASSGAVAGASLHAASSGASAGPSSAGGSTAFQPDELLHTAAPDADTCDQALHDETYALGLVQWAGGKLEALLQQPEHAAWAAPGLRTSRLKELASLRAQTSELPGVSIVVVGNTGAGKSTLLNALLGEVSILPTNGMRACTACLIEMRHEDSDPVRVPPYRAEIEFLSQQEWERELSDLLDDLTPNDGPNQGRVSLSVAEDSVAYGSWCKIYAVYGDDVRAHLQPDRCAPAPPPPPVSLAAVNARG